MDVLVYASAFVIAYAYVVYPAVIAVWGTVFPRRIDKRYAPVPVSVVLAVRDEAARVRARIENLLAQDYPPDLLEVVVVSDGSTDGTVEAARAVGDPRVRVVDLPEPRGKAHAVRVGVAQARGEVVVFADARQRFEENVLAELTAILHDERVGAASGELLIHPPDGSEVGEGVGAYWRYEKFVRRMESAADSVIGATGSIYAVRRALFEPPEDGVLLDDVLVPMRIALRGYRVVYTRSARAHDTASPSSADEFRRKVRTLAGNFQLVSVEPRLIDPRRNRLWFQFVSHKLARLVVPYACVGALAGAALADGPVHAWFWVQAAFYALAALGPTPVGRSRWGTPVRLPWTFVVLNAAAAAGLWVFVTGRSATVWRGRRGP